MSAASTCSGLFFASINIMNEIIIIGAGLSGLSCAQALKTHNINATIVDKGRGVGGRMATRRLEDKGETATFDHGAQFFTARDEKFQDMVRGWCENGLAREWFRGQSKAHLDGRVETDSDGHPRFCATRGMNSIAKHLAQDLDVKTAQRVTKLAWNGDHWTLHFADASTCSARSLLLTCPVPQSLALLDAGEMNLPADLRAQLDDVTYESCVAALLWLKGAGRVPSPGALYCEDEPIAWLGDNFQKGVSSVEGAITVHGAPKWSAENYTLDDEKTVQVLARAAQAFLGAEIRASSVARWKFSKPNDARDDGFLRWDEANLVFAGDAFGGSKVEGAIRSGWAAAKVLSD